MTVIVGGQLFYFIINVIILAVMNEYEYFAIYCYFKLFVKVFL